MMRFSMILALLRIRMAFKYKPFLVSKQRISFYLCRLAKFANHLESYHDNKILPALANRKDWSWVTKLTRLSSISNHSIVGLPSIKSRAFSTSGNGGDDEKKRKDNDRASHNRGEHRSEKSFWAQTKLVWLGIGTLTSASCAILWYLNQRFDDIIDFFEEREANNRYVYPFDPAEVKYFLKKHCFYLFPSRFTQSTPTAWELLQELDKGGTARDAAIDKIATMEDLSESDYVTLAISMDLPTSIAVAYNGGDPKLFPPPPSCAGPVEDFKAYYAAAFRHIVDPLPDSSISYTLNFLFRNTLETFIPTEQELHDHALNLYTGFDEIPLHSSSSKEIGEVKFLKVCLQVVASHTRNFENIKLIPKSELLEVLTVIAGQYPDNVELMSFVLKVLANLACDPSYAEPIRDTGCLHILAEAAQSSDVRILLPAKRALFNLNREGNRHILAPGIYQVYPDFRADESIFEYDIVFIHGILGGAFRTWRQQDKEATFLDTPSSAESPNQRLTFVIDKPGLASRILFKMPPEDTDKDSVQSRIELDDGTVIYSNDEIPLELDEDNECPSTKCWPRDWLPMDCPKARIIAVDFDSFVTHWSGYCPVETTKRSLKDRGSELLQKLHKAGVGERPIIWVTHSMGGLLAKSILTQAAEQKDYQDIVGNTKALVFCSVPHVGSYIALANSSRRYFFMPTEEALELTNSDNSLTLLHENFLKLLRAFKFRILSFGEMLETKSVFRIAFKMVPFASADPGVGDFFKIRLNHLNTCKPSNRQSFIYRKIVELIHKVEEDIEKAKK